MILIHRSFKRQLFKKVNKDESISEAGIKRHNLKFWNTMRDD